MKKKILIIESNYYPSISDALLDGAKKTIVESQFDYEKLSVHGVLEIPVLLEKYKNDYIGFVTLGCVIRGETSHYDIVTRVSSESIFKIINTNKLAHGFGLITAENFAQAEVRADPEKKNIGGVAVKVCLKMISLLKK